MLVMKMIMQMMMVVVVKKEDEEKEERGRETSKSFTHLPLLIMIPTANYARWVIVMVGESRVRRWLGRCYNLEKRICLCAI